MSSGRRCAAAITPAAHRLLLPAASRSSASTIVTSLPLFITPDPAWRPPVVRHPGKLRKDAARDRGQHRDRADAWPHLFRQVAASRQRLHHRHQRRHPGALAGLLAVRAVQRDFDHVEVRAAGQRPPPLESVQLRHLVMLFLAGETMAALSIQWGTTTVADAGDLGAGRDHHLSRCTFSHHRDLRRLVRRARVPAQLAHGHPWQAEIAPITGPMYQLFIFFMITDPKTTVRSKQGQCVVAFGVALAEFFLRLDQVVYAPIFALFFVGPAANLIEIWWDSRGTTSEPARV